MAKENYHIVKTADDSMTTYKVVGMDRADDAAICQALTAAAQDVWQYLTTTPGAYTAAQLASCKNIMPLSLREDKKLPKELSCINVECGAFKCGIGMKADNFDMLFVVLAEFEKLANVQIKDRAMFTARMELGKLLCEAQVILPADMKQICACCANDELRPAMNYPGIDLDRRCIVATDGAMVVAQKFTLASISYEDKVPETFCLPKEVARMQGEVTVQLYEEGCTVIDQRGVEVSVKHELMRYPHWERVWPELRSGQAIVYSKEMSKAIKSAVAAMYKRGKGDNEVVLLTHEAESDAISICGYEGGERRNSQSLPDIVATDEVAWRMAVKSEYMQKALAFDPKTMYAGYREGSTLPGFVIMEDATAEVAVMLCTCVDEDGRVCGSTNAAYAVKDKQRLYHCFSPDGWLLEPMETKYPTKKAVSVEGAIKLEGSEYSVKDDGKDVTFASYIPQSLSEKPQPSAIKHQPSATASLEDRLRVALLNILTTTPKVA